MVPAIIIGVILVLFVIGSYNSLVAKKNGVKTAFSTVDVLLKKRYDLIPNLVATVKSYMEHEKDLLTKVTELRSKAMGAGESKEERFTADNEVSKAVRGIMVAVENYPDLKVNQNFIQLQDTMTEVEEQISAGRRAYNAAVLEYNNAVQMFPTNIFASMFNYTLENFFEADETERQNVNVSELFKG